MRYSKTWWSACRVNFLKVRMTPTRMVLEMRSSMSGEEDKECGEEDKECGEEGEGEEGKGRRGRGGGEGEEGGGGVEEGERRWN